MTTQPLLGRVVVIAGDDDRLAPVADAAVAAGAQVAVVSVSLPECAATVRFRADPSDEAVWDRLAMHVEQHLGPVDGVVTDRAAGQVVSRVFGPDLARRGHGTVVQVEDIASADVVTRALRTP